MDGGTDVRTDKQISRPALLGLFSDVDLIKLSQKY